MIGMKNDLVEVLRVVVRFYEGWLLMYIGIVFLVEYCRFYLNIFKELKRLM